MHLLRRTMPKNAGKLPLFSPEYSVHGEQSSFAKFWLISLKDMALLLVGQASCSLASPFRPIRVNKSLLPSDMDTLHERRWLVHYRREETISMLDDNDYVIEEVGNIIICSTGKSAESFLLMRAFSPDPLRSGGGVSGRFQSCCSSFHLWHIKPCRIFSAMEDAMLLLSASRLLPCDLQQALLLL